MNEVIYQLWTSDNAITPNRIAALATSKNVFGVECRLLKKDDIKKMILSDFPIHPAYKYLSAVHKSDYLRSYFMNFYGGGYADIKFFSSDNNWKQCFELMATNDEIEVVGQHEVPNGSGIVYLNTPSNLQKILSNGWFICRPHSKFTEEWYKRTQLKMDQRHDILKRFPATDPYGGKNYPLRWGELLCEIFHPMCQETYQDNPKRIKNCLIPGVVWKEYR